MASVAADEGVGLGISPDEAGLRVVGDEGLERGPRHLALLVQGVVAQPTLLGALGEVLVPVGLHHVPGLQELD